MQDYNLGPSVSVEAVGDKYDQTSTYAVGDYCIKDDKLYVCNTAIETAEAWNASHWTDTTIADVLKTIPSVVNNVTTNDGTKALSAAQGKTLNDKVTDGYRGIAYLVGTTNGSTAIPAGSFVYVNDNGNGVADGLYTANEAIGAYYQITTSRVTAVPVGGGLNALNSNFSIVETNVTPVSGMTFNRTRIQKYGRLCTFAINATVTSGSGWVTIATIPAEVKPIDTFQSIIVNDSTFAAIEARVTANGYVQLWNSPNAAVWGSIWWFC